MRTYSIFVVLIISMPLPAISFSSLPLMPHFVLLISCAMITRKSVVQGQPLPLPSSLSQSFLYTPTCSNMKDTCPENVPESECKVDPCADPDACPTGQGLTCHANFCGGCNAVCCIDPLFCPLDAKLCPDGITYVTRNHYDDCNFLPCEEEETGNGLVCASDVKSCPDGQEVSRDPTNDCEYYSCGGKLDGDNDTDPITHSCATDIQRCYDNTFVSRDPDMCCLFEPCPNLGTIQIIMQRIQDRVSCVFN